jgi:hypothetical protein
VAPPAPRYSSATVLEPEPAGALPNRALKLAPSRPSKAELSRLLPPVGLGGG